MFATWCNAVACDGVKDWYSSKTGSKTFAFWSVVLIILMGASAWFTYITIQRYIDNPHVTNVEAVTNASMNLPEILVCYNGGLNISSFKEYNVSNDFIIAYHGYFAYHSDLEAMDHNKKLQSILLTKKINLLQLATKLGYSCKDIVISFNHPFNREWCDGTEMWLTESGSCYAFKNKYDQWFPGVNGGHAITLIEPDNSFAKVYPNDSLDLGINSEFKIAVEANLGHQQSRRYILVPTKTKVEVVLNAKRYIRLNDDDRCSDELNFTSNSCYFNCWAEAIKKWWNCTPIFLLGSHIFNDTEICNPFTTDVLKFNLTYLLTCNAQCKPLCNEWLFDPTISYSHLESSVTFGQPMSVVSIGYSTLQYTKIEEIKAFSIDMAISNVGGQSGLWLGLSAVTFVQTFYYLMSSLWDRCSARDIKVQELK